MNRAVLLAAVGAALVLTAPAQATAQRNARQARATIARLLEDARARYDNLELDEAENVLARAIGLAERFDLRSPVVADLFVQRAILFHVRDRDQARTVADFKRALEINPEAQLDRLVSTPSLERLFKMARQEMAPPPRITERPPNNPRDGRRALIHDPVRRVRSREAMTVLIKVDNELNRDIYRVYVYFRTRQADSVQRLEMMPEGTSSFIAKIPARFVAGRNLSYYIVAENRQGVRLAGVGNAQSPVDVEITGDDLEKLASGSDLLGGDHDGQGLDDYDDYDDDDDDDDHGARKHVAFTLSVGTGGGYITEHAEPVQVKSTPVVAGFAATPFHTLAEIDFWVTSIFGLGAFARLQVVEFADLWGARSKFQVLNKAGNHLVLRAGGGWGEVRHLVNLGPFSDTTLEGPYFWTVGVAYQYDLSDTFALTIAPDFFHMFGSSPSYQIDFALGVQVGF